MTQFIIPQVNVPFCVHNRTHTCIYNDNNKKMHTQNDFHVKHVRKINCVKSTFSRLNGVLGSDKYYIMYDILVCVTFDLIIIFLDDQKKKNHTINSAHIKI